MSNKFFILSLIIFGLTTCCISFNVDAQTNENEFGKLDIAPDISTNAIRQLQYYNLTWYKPSNTIDFAFSFDIPLSYGRVYYWNGNDYVKVNHERLMRGQKYYYVVTNVNVNQFQTIHGYWEYDVPFGSSGKWDLYAKLSDDDWQTAFQSNRFIHLDPWWNSNWNKRMDLYIDDTGQVEGTLTNFPILVQIDNNEDIYDYVQNDLDDIVFVSSDNLTQYNHEIEYYNYGGGIVNASIWVNITSLTSGMHFNMYYNNVDCENQENINDTWSSNYDAVFHLSDLHDSTSNGLSLTNHGATLKDSIIGSCYDFENTENDYLEENGNLLTSSMIEMYISCWVKKESVEGGGYYTVTSRDDGTDAMQLVITGSADENGYAWVKGAGNSADAQGTITVDVGKWHYLATSYSNNDNLVRQITDGRIISSAFSDLFGGSTYDFNIGAWAGETSNDFDGYIEECRVLNTAVSGAWIRACYNTVNNRTGVTPFVVFGSSSTYTSNETNVTDSNVTVIVGSMDNYQRIIFIALTFFFIVLAEWKDDFVYYLVSCIFTLNLGFYMFAYYNGVFMSIVVVSVLLLGVYYSFLALASAYKHFVKR